VFAYAEGLDDIVVTRRALAQEEATVTVTIDSADDWAALIGRGVSLERQPAILRRWWEGMTLDQARLMLDGRTEQPVYEDASDPLEVAIVRRIAGESFAILEEDGVVDRITHPNIAGTGTYRRDKDTIDGAFYPIPIGLPGIVPAAVGTERPASPALLIKFSTNGSDQDDRMLIGAGKLEVADVSASVRIFDATARPTVSEVFDCESATDAIGNVVTLAKMNATKDIGGVSIAYGREYWAAFLQTDGAKGGAVDARTGIRVRGAGSLILWLLSNFSNEPIDTGRMKATAERLDVVLIDTYINDGDIKARDWIQTHLMPLLPIEPVWGIDGFYYRIKRWDATKTDAIARFDADPGGNCDQMGPVKPAGTQIFNRFSIAYRHDRDKGRYRARAFVRADTDPNDTRKGGSLLCARSVHRYGTLRSPRIKTPVLWDESSAVQVLVWQVLAHAWPKRLVAAAIAPEWESLEEGDVILYNNTASSIIDQPALVTTLQIGSPNQIAAEFTLLDHPVHTVHAV
jgi:hypothetical protein